MRRYLATVKASDKEREGDFEGGCGYHGIAYDAIEPAAKWLQAGKDIRHHLLNSSKCDLWRVSEIFNSLSPGNA